MAQTTDMAPTRRRPAANGAATRSRAARAPRRDTEHLEDQVTRLQDDLKAITQTLARMSDQKVAEVRDAAKDEVKHLVHSGKNAIDDVTDQANALERQLKTMVRDKPLTAIGAALGVGFILALMARQ
jgi:ElaB/YqjD/DUF883 family membrane-anchored ribosome-binding protein